MSIGKVFAIFFSPTDGTKGYVREIAKRFSPDFEELDLTNPDNREKGYVFGKDDLVVFGVPVYFGRVPQVQIFDNLKGSGTRAIYVVTYGNREYDDALLEEADICKKNGFIGIAAAALIAPHTYSRKIAKDRPNDEDISALEGFVERVKSIHETSESVRVKGNSPYKKYGKIPFAPKANKKCNKCGACAKKCPVRAIPAAAPMETDKSKCITCLSCVKICPQGARNVKNVLFYLARFMLERSLLKRDKKPEFFYV